VICLDRPQSHALLPCGHLALCEPCSAKVVEQSALPSDRLCPVCREPAQQAVRVYVTGHSHGPPKRPERAPVLPFTLSHAAAQTAPHGHWILTALATAIAFLPGLPHLLDFHSYEANLFLAHLLLTSSAPFLAFAVQWAIAPRRELPPSKWLVRIYWLQAVVRCANALSAARALIEAANGGEAGEDVQLAEPPPEELERRSRLYFYLTLDLCRLASVALLFCTHALLLSWHLLPPWTVFRNVSFFPPTITMLLMLIGVAAQPAHPMYTPNNTPLPYLLVRFVCFYVAAAVSSVYPR